MDCTRHGTQLFSSIVYAAAPSSAQCVLRLKSKISISFSRASLSATSEHGNPVTKENVNLLRTQTQQGYHQSKIRTENFGGMESSLSLRSKKEKTVTVSNVSGRRVFSPSSSKMASSSPITLPLPAEPGRDQ